jgi:hypothetical protein
MLQMFETPECVQGDKTAARRICPTSPESLRAAGLGNVIRQCHQARAMRLRLALKTFSFASIPFPPLVCRN